MEQNIRRIYKLCIAIVILVAINLFITLMANVSFKSNKVEETKSEETTNTYDVSMFNSVTIKDILSMFDSNKTYVVYLGRSSCSACVNFLPTLQSMQKKYNYVTQYLDITTVKSGTDEYDEFISKLNKEVTITSNGEPKTDKYGNFFGYTPMTFIIRNGKFQDGIVGSYSKDRFEQFLQDNGIK